MCSAKRLSRAPWKASTRGRLLRRQGLMRWRWACTATRLKVQDGTPGMHRDRYCRTRKKREGKRGGMTVSTRAHWWQARTSRCRSTSRSCSLTTPSPAWGVSSASELQNAIRISRSRARQVQVQDAMPRTTRAKSTTSRT